jgi:putative FmdB family regulatory protein
MSSRRKKMPVYEYKCKTCGKIFDYQQKISEEPLTKCPAEMCENGHKGEGEVFRMISKNIGLVFNGKGFYLTDYVHKKESLPKSRSTEHKSTDTSGEKPVETKTAEKVKDKAPAA